MSTASITITIYDGFARTDDNDKFKVYRMTDEDPYDTSTNSFKAGVDTFEGNASAGTGPIDWVDTTVANNTNYYYRFTLLRTSSNSESSPSSVIGPFNLNKVDQLAYPSRINNPAQSGLTNFIDTSPWLHYDAKYEADTKGMGHIYHDNTQNSLENLGLPDINIASGSGSGTTNGSQMLIDYVDPSGTNHGIPIIGSSFHAVVAQFRTGWSAFTYSGWDSASRSFQFNEGLTVISLCALHYKRNDGNNTAITAELDYVMSLNGSAVGSNKFKTWDSYISEYNGTAPYTRYSVCPWRAWQEAEIVAGRQTRRFDFPGLPFNSDPTDERNGNHAYHWGGPSSTHGVWGNWTDINNPKLNVNNSDENPEGYKQSAWASDSLNLLVYRQSPQLDRYWWANGDLTAYQSKEHTANYFHSDQSGTAAAIFSACPNWTHFDSSSSSSYDPRYQFAPQGVVSFNNLLANSFTNDGIAEFLVIPKDLSGEEILRVVEYLRNKWGVVTTQLGYVGA